MQLNDVDTRERGSFVLHVLISTQMVSLCACQLFISSLKECSYALRKYVESYLPQHGDIVHGSHFDRSTPAGETVKALKSCKREAPLYGL